MAAWKKKSEEQRTKEGKPDFVEDAEKVRKDRKPLHEAYTATMHTAAGQEGFKHNVDVTKSLPEEERAAFRKSVGFSDDELYHLCHPYARTAATGTGLDASIDVTDEAGADFTSTESEEGNLEELVKEPTRAPQKPRPRGLKSNRKFPHCPPRVSPGHRFYHVLKRYKGMTEQGAASDFYCKHCDDYIQKSHIEWLTPSDARRLNAEIKAARRRR